MNPRFAVLSVLSVVLRVLGWIVVLFSVVIGWSTYEAYGGVTLQFLLSTVPFIIAGLFCVVLGELIGVAFAIEANTRRTAALLSKSRQARVGENETAAVASESQGKIRCGNCGSIQSFAVGEHERYFCDMCGSKLTAENSEE